MMQRAFIDIPIPEADRRRVRFCGIAGTTVSSCTNGTITILLDNGQRQVTMPGQLAALEEKPGQVGGFHPVLATVDGCDVRGGR